ncbi:probable ATP-dependent RNA helicase DDX46 isoform X2 [Macrosteles quadrilineatus]|uniref:probable ATP-dependent RNA helicase DDX46 isoform X2 n=1 Tax=Macrosteles quadrilineatus TaxID=74068 RepID=UPI0023E14F1F|nr:probable ATP-dependent RNA helicase DDX46 isoform X2 [Macrosteles quadrilineatus]XP_054267791.1 probable ATP-dependent RNA helicase DDX46 isoform X2 [Macrosteles quadrilineatus]
MVRSGHHRKRSRSRSVTPDHKRSKSSRDYDKDRLSRRSRDRERLRRSWSRDRKKDKRDSESRGKSKPKSKHRSRSRSRSRSKSKEKNDKAKKEEKKEVKADDEPFDPTNLDKEEEQKRLELEMQKRRERIERWRAERKKKELEQVKKDMKNSLANLQLPSKKWNLEDDSDEEDEAKTEGKADEVEEVDTLDAFMQEVQEEVRKVNKMDSIKSGTEKGLPPPQPGSGVTIVTGVAKKKATEKRKGELIEQNQDGLEYLSEEEEEDLTTTASNLANKQKKELAKVDHAGMDYMSFRKSFYLEVPEITKMTTEEVEAYREELEGIRVKGKGCPKPIKTWAQCGVSKKMMEALKKQDYEKPTPIQAQAIPAIMSGRDLIGIAKTGSGKTLAFVLPMLRHIMDQPPLEANDGPIALIMTPTRELCMQIGKETRKFTKSLNLRVVCVYGGTGISEQIAELKRGAEIIVCTPGRMIDMLAANNGRVTNLKRVTYIVLDEADRMFDMGFEPQVMRIIENIRPDRQTVMFSATFPRQMEALARRILNKPIEIQVGGRSVVCREVEQHVVVLEEEQKFLKLLELLGVYQDQGSVIVFVDKQENADALLKDLMKASYPCMSLHGGIDQYDRDSTIVDFKAGKVKLLIATSVAARGLDVKQLILVVNYDCPNHYEDYVHRCGRTGRAGNKGYAFTFITPEQERYSGDIVRAFELAGVTVPDPLRNLFEGYKAKQLAEGKKVHSGGGFSGKGFKFDEQEAQMVNEKKKFQKAALGLQDSDDEDLEGDIDQQIESMLAPKRIVKEIKAPLGSLNPTSTTQAGTTTSPAQVTTDKLELAKRLASRINMAKNLGAEAKGATQQAAEAILKGGGSQPIITAKTVAEQLAAKLNTRLNYQPKDNEDKSEDEQVETFRKYEEELEINDFPQQARWRVTSKEALAQISEYSEAGITVRGTYYPQGKSPPEGERKLFLAIESTNELAVSKAKIEITRLIKEELLKLQTSAHHSINKARYKVL